MSPINGKLPDLDASIESFRINKLKLSLYLSIELLNRLRGYHYIVAK